MAIQRTLCPVLVGREQELTVLEDALLAANRGEGQIVVLAGEAGVGKTRLASELQRRALKFGMAALWGGSSEAELALPYLPFLEAIGNYLRRIDLEMLRQRLGPARHELALLFPQLESRQVAQDDSESVQAKLRLFEAILTLLDVPADESGLLLVIEDLHWADASTRELLDYLARRLRNTRIMLLATYRSDELHRKHPLLPIMQGWRRTSVAEVVELKPLPPDGVADMVHAIFDQPIRGEFRDFLHGRCEGNPFVLEEFLKAALDRGDIYRTTTRWERKALEAMKIPATVRDTILLRVERLSAAQAEILRTAAVLGPSFSYQTLVALSGRGEKILQDALQACVQQQLMEEQPQTAQRFRFRHALTREAIYEDLIAPKRQQLHLRAAQVLREVPGTPAVDLAYHLLAASEWEQAIPVCIQAAEEAEHRVAYRGAVELLGQILPHVQDDPTRGQVLCRLGRAHYLANEFGRAQSYLEAGIALLEACGQTQVAASYRLSLGGCYRQRDRPDLNRTEAEKVRAILEPAGPSEDLASAYVRLASEETFDGRFREALGLARRAIALAESARADGPRISAYEVTGRTLGYLGQADEGIAYLDRAYREAVDQGRYGTAATAAVNGMSLLCNSFRARQALARVELLRSLPAGSYRDFAVANIERVIYWCLGNLPKAWPAHLHWLKLARQSEAAYWMKRGEGWLATLQAAFGNFDEALRILPPYNQRWPKNDIAYYLALTMRIFVDAGDLESAVREAQRVLDVAYSAPPVIELLLFDGAVEVFLKVERIEQAEQLVDSARKDQVLRQHPTLGRLEGRLALARGDLAQACQYLDTAASFLQEVGYRMEEARTRRTLAEVKARQGDRAGAEAELRKVLAYADEYDATFEGRCAREQLAQLGVETAPARPARPTAQAEDLRQASERLVTVMFVDVRGYTAMTAKEAPHEMTEKLATFQRWAKQEIERHHGLVDKFAGDAVMATFNVSGLRLDHALHALQAAIAIRDKAAYAGLPVGIGIAVGPAIVGQLTAGANVTAVGETTNLAARLQAQAAAGEILLSEEAYRRVRSWTEDQNLGTQEERLTLKGFAQSVTVRRVPAPVRAVR